MGRVPDSKSMGTLVIGVLAVSVVFSIALLVISGIGFESPNPTAGLEDDLEAILNHLSALQSQMDSNADMMDQILARLSPGAGDDLLDQSGSPNGVDGTTTQTVSLVIEANDTIWGIANRFQSPPTQSYINAILELNGLSDPSRLRVGQRIVIPVIAEGR